MHREMISDMLLPTYIAAEPNVPEVGGKLF
jgi:hypothetical protein